MRVQVVMPQLGESIVEGTIVEWHKKVGDVVEKDEELFTITTDKVDTDVPAPQAGVLVEILANIDDTVAVGELVAVLDTEASAGASAGAAKAAEPAAAPAAVEAVAPVESAPAAEAADPGVQLSPVARKLLEEAGITHVPAITGSGVGGRILKQDVQDYLEAQASPAEPAPAQRAELQQTTQVAPEPQRTPTASAMTQVAAPPILTRTASSPPASVKPSQPTQKPAAPRVSEQRPQGPKFNLPIIQPDPRSGLANIQVNPEDRVEPMSPSRVAVSRNLTHARRTAAHCSTVWEVDVTDLVAARARMQADYDKLNVNLTFTPFFLAGVANALLRFPVLNAATDGENIVYRGEINIGIASAWKDGLIVPAIRGANSLSLLGLARAVNDVQRRTEVDELRPTDIDQATFTVTNSGVLGAKYGVPTLFPPQVGILSVGTIEKRVVVGKDDSIRVRSMANICLTFDHRVVDFNDADGFMKHLVEYLETTEW